MVMEVEGILPGVEGFESSGEAFLFVPGLSLWSSLESLGGQWLAHDPLLIQTDWVRRHDPQPLDLDSLLDLDRTHAQPLPDADTIRDALDEGLTPAPLYRVRWRRSG